MYLPADQQIAVGGFSIGAKAPFEIYEKCKIDLIGKIIKIHIIITMTTLLAR